MLVVTMGIRPSFGWTLLTFRVKNETLQWRQLALFISDLASVKSRMVYLSGAGLPRLSWKEAVKRMCVILEM